MSNEHRITAHLGADLREEFLECAPPDYNFSADVRALLRRRIAEWKAAKGETAPESVG